MLRAISLAGAFAVAITAQSPLTTIFAGTAAAPAGGTVYVNLVLNAPLTFTQIDVNSTSPPNTQGVLEVRWCPMTYVGNHTNLSAWTLGGSGPVTTAGQNQPSICVLTPFTLPAGNYGFAVTHVGIGAFTRSSNQTYATSEAMLLPGAVAHGPIGTAICCTPRVLNCNLHYVVAGSGTIAHRTPYGVGCQRRDASLYERFATSPAFDLANTAISWVPMGSGYLVLPGVTTFLPPSASAVQLGFGDDNDVAVQLAAPFVHPGGSTSSLRVCSNGFVSVGIGNGTGFPVFATSAATMLAAPQTAWWNWHDNDGTLLGSGRGKFEQIAGIAYITWDGVWDFGGTSSANANTFQFQFDTNTGAVHLVIQTMSVLGYERLVGYSPGGASLDPGNSDISAVLPAWITLSGGDVSPLALAASSRPLIGTSIDLVTSNPTGLNVGVNFLSFVAIPAPGIDLGIIGAPGCPALVDINAGVGNIIGNLGWPGLLMSVPLAIPNNTGLLSSSVFTQSAWLDPTANAFGLLTSNGVELVLGNL